MHVLFEFIRKSVMGYVLGRTLSGIQGTSKELQMIEKAISANSQGEASAKVKEYAKYFLSASKELGLTLTADVLLHLASQVGHETSGFRFCIERAKKGVDENEYFEEMYGMRKGLGNTTPGDGAKYKGRGFIQLTGKYNYEVYGQKVGVDLVSNPDLASEPKIAAKVALAYFKDRVFKKMGDPDFEQEVIAVSKAINCPNAKTIERINGLPDRLARAKRTKDVLSC